MEKAHALFPSLDPRNTTGCNSANDLQEIKAKVEELSRVRFKLKDFRPTLNSATINGDMKLLPLMTAQLGHFDPDTTVWKGRSIMPQRPPLLTKNSR